LRGQRDECGGRDRGAQPLNLASRRSIRWLNTLAALLHQKT